MRENQEIETYQKAKKRKKTTQDATEIENVNLTWGMANYLPPQHESEDETAVDLHVSWLKREFQKQKRMMVL